MAIFIAVASVSVVAPLRVDTTISRLLRSSQTLRPDATLAELDEAADGLATWRRALAAGRAPDFNGIDAAQSPWPPQPLLGTLTDAVSKLGLPRTTSRHPSLIPAALTAVLAATARFSNEVDRESLPAQSESYDAGGDWDDPFGTNIEDGVPAEDEEQPLDDEDERLREAAEQISAAFADEWSAPLRGVRAIETLGGADGGGDAGALTAAAGSTFSPADGLWQHTGWVALEGVQKQLREITELTELIQNLGQRAAADGIVQRGAAVTSDARAAPSAALCEHAPRELSGLCRTGELGRVAPSELHLIAKSADDEDDSGVGARRRLFLSRLAERRLLGYKLEGYAESAGRPKRKKLERLPRSRGGPLVVCLDTSHSMAGGRERLAKAVVLETVKAAHSQGRPCLLFAFSAANDLAELRLTPPKRGRRRKGGGLTDRRSLTRLLDFLACSFGGGTDVAGPLRRALDVLEKPDAEEVVYSGADILLVSDGELPNPPLDEPTHSRLRALQSKQGFEVHGLLVGKPRPTPLDLMCDEVHTCLSAFDPLAILREKSDARKEEAAAAATGRRSRGGAAVMMCDATDDDIAASLRERASERVQAALKNARMQYAAKDVDAANSDGGNTLRAAAAALETGLVEREGEARLLLLALVGGEHLLLLGPPGTAKSALCRRLSSVCNLSYFERTLTRFSTPEELFGPLSLAALERDEYRRATTGFAPDAELLFIDEIFKSNSAILNTLLTLLNERIFDDGAQRKPVPLLSAVAASNEGPESEELAALYDRFLLRKLVSPVSDDGVLEMLMGSEAAAAEDAASESGSVVVGDDEVSLFDAVLALRGTLQTVREATPSVELPRWVALLLRDARAHVRLAGAEGQHGSGYVSDRRLRRVAELLKSSAAAHGRTSVSVLDTLAVLPHVLWEEPEDAMSLSDWVEENALPDGGGEQLEFLLSSVRGRVAAAAEEEPVAEEDVALKNDVSALATAALNTVTEMQGHLSALEDAREHLFMPPQQAATILQRLLPLARERVEELSELAIAAAALEMGLSEGAAEAALMVAGGGAESSETDEDEEEGMKEERLNFTDEELAWGRKEAKAKLDTETFKAWRKAVKKAK